MREDLNPAPPPSKESTSSELEPPVREAALPEDAVAASTATSLDDWKAAVRLDFDKWLDSIDDIPELTDADFEVADTPDL